MRAAYRLIDGKWEETDDAKGADVVRDGNRWTLRNPSVMPDLFFIADSKSEFRRCVKEYNGRYTPCELFDRAVELL